MTGMAPKPRGWYEALAEALARDGATAMQLATIDHSTNKPRVRSHLQRAFIVASTRPNVPLILSTTDVRAPKVTQLAAHPIVELVYWIPHTVEQIRVTGLASIVPRPGYRGPYPAVPSGGVYNELAQEGFDWEARRVQTFDAMSAHMRATWCRPVPGSPLVPGEEAKWPASLPGLKEPATELEQAQLATALDNFSLLVVEPYEVDYGELGVVPEKRRRYERDEGGEGFKETWIVP